VPLGLPGSSGFASPRAPLCQFGEAGHPRGSGSRCSARCQWPPAANDHAQAAPVGSAFVGLCAVSALAAGSSCRSSPGKRRNRRSRLTCRALPKSLSPSSLADFEQCPKKFEFKSVLRISQGFDETLLRGGTVHAILQGLFDLPAEERTLENAIKLATKRAGEIITSQLRKGQWLNKDKEEDKELALKWVDDVVEAVRKYFLIEDPRLVHMVHSERYLSTEFITDTQLPLGSLCGRLDRLDREPSSDGQNVFTVVDYKTGRAPKSPALVSDAFQQLAMYAVLLVRDKLYGPDVVRGKLLYLGGEEPAELSKTFTAEDLKQTILHVRGIRKDIAAAATSPEGFEARPSAHCDKCCSYRSRCPAFK